MSQEKNLFKWDRMMTKPHATKVPIILKPIFQRSSSIPKDLNINNSNNRKGSIEQIEKYAKRYNSGKPALKMYDTKIDLIRPKFKQNTENSTRKELSELLNDENAKHLIELDLSNYNLKNIVKLDKFTNLKELNLACNQITKIENLSNFKHLNEIKLYGNQIEIIENFDVSMVSLTSLQLQSNRIKKLDKGLHHLKNLEYLRLDRNELTTIHPHEVTSLLNLVYLNISNNSLSTLNFINYLPNLEELVASDCNLEKFDIDPTRCKKLTDLDISNNRLGDESLVALEGLKNLNDLNASSNLLKSLSQISKVKNLKILNVSSNKIEKLEDLKNVRELEILDVSSNKINNWSQLEYLKILTELIELDISNNPIMNEKTVNDIRILLPNIQISNDYQNLVKKESLLSQQDNRDTHLTNELLEFEREIDSINQNFLKKFKEISLALESIDDNCTNILPIDSNSRPTSVRSSSNLSRLQDALIYAKHHKN